MEPIEMNILRQITQIHHKVFMIWKNNIPSILRQEHNLNFKQMFKI